MALHTRPVRKDLGIGRGLHVASCRMIVLVVGCVALFAGRFSSADEVSTTNPPSVVAVSPRRFEYKLSFKGPHLVQGDGVVPFWQHGGSAIASDESVRVTPSLKSKKGYIWSTQQNTHAHWEVEMVFRINGPGRLGADGLAFWYTEEKGVEGPVFGSNDYWKGLAVFMDSFDNDAAKNNPYVMVMVNNGTVSYNHETDGSAQQMGGCLRDFRNRPYAVRMRVVYQKRTLTVHFHNGGSTNLQDYELCLRADDISLPATGYFGISAATGGLADDHDVISFLTHSLTEPVTNNKALPTPISEDEKARFETEFEEYWKKLEEAKEDYKKNHPDAKPKPDEEQTYVSPEVKELRMIFEGQNAIHSHLRDVQSRLDNIVPRIENSIQNALATTQAGAAGIPEGSILQDMKSLLVAQNDLSRNFNEISSAVERLSSKSDALETLVHIDKEMKRQQEAMIGSFSVMQNEMRSILQRAAPEAKPCPTSPSSCVTTLTLFLFIVVQTAVGLGYLIYQNRQAAAAKKFY